MEAGARAPARFPGASSAPSYRRRCCHQALRFIVTPVCTHLRRRLESQSTGASICPHVRAWATSHTARQTSTPPAAVTSVTSGTGHDRSVHTPPVTHKPSFRARGRAPPRPLRTPGPGLAGEEAATNPGTQPSGGLRWVIHQRRVGSRSAPAASVNLQRCQAQPRSPASGSLGFQTSEGLRSPARLSATVVGGFTFCAAAPA